MKRLIVISVIFALVAGAAFAEINVGGAVFGRWDVLTGTSQKDLYNVPNPNPLDLNYKGDTALNSRGIYTGGTMTRIRIDGSGQSEDGTFGGYARIEGGDFGTPNTYGNAWWKPIDQFKLLVGSAGYDGFFGKDGVTRWGFYRDAGDVYGNIEGWAFGASFYDGFQKGGILTITPLEMLEINIGIPFFDGGRAEGVFKSTVAQVAFNIDGIGQVAVTYKGGYQGDTRDQYGFLTRKPKAYYPTTGSDAWPLPEPDYVAGTTTPAIKFGKEFVYDIADAGGNGAPKFYAYFDLSAIENLGVQLGIGFTLPRKEEVEDGDLNTPGDPTSGSWTSKETIKYNAPLAVGLGVSFDAGAFGIKARVQGEFAEKFTWEGSYTNTNGGLGGTAYSASISRELKGPFVLTGDILPSFAINDSMKIFLSAGLKLKAGYDVLSVEENPLYDSPANTPNIEEYIEVNKTQDSVVGWHIMPYFTKSVGWCQAFYVGFRLSSSGAKWTESYGRDAAGYLDPDKPNKKSIINWAVPIGVAFQF